MSKPEHVVFGSGAIGTTLVEVLHRRGQSVRVVNRSGTAKVPGDVEVVGGDARDPAFTRAVADGAKLVYQVLNPPYHRWLQEFPGLQAITTKLGVRATPVEEALTATLASYR